MPDLRDYSKLDYEGGLTDIPGIKLGHFSDTRRPTGCTAVLFEEGVIGGVDVRGSAPGTRETELLSPLGSVEEIHGLMLSGGSAFGLDAASGLVRYLEEKGIGYQTGVVPVPIVPAAILFDLRIGDPTIRPGIPEGHEAARLAGSGPIGEGSVGCGTGATVGKMLGPDRAMKGGIGSASCRFGDLVVAALVAVNAAGNVIDPATGQIVAGARTADGARLAPLEESLRSLHRPLGPSPAENTTLAIVATNARFDKAGMTKIAQMGHDGLARAINPVHTPFDGDLVFAVSTRTVGGASLAEVGSLAAQVVSKAIVRAVLQAEGLPGFPSAHEMRRQEGHSA